MKLTESSRVADETPLPAALYCQITAPKELTRRWMPLLRNWKEVVESAVPESPPAFQTMMSLIPINVEGINCEKSSVRQINNSVVSLTEDISIMGYLCLFSLLIFGFLSKSQLVYAQLLHDETTTLLAIGKELGLTDWGLNNTYYCSWPGIGCALNSSMVEKLELSHRGLEGNITLVSELKALKWLDLSSNNFHGSIPPSFGNLSELEFLDLALNKFGSSIPVELGRLRNLRSLNLSNNLLTGQIPYELEGLENLQEFQIFTNKLSGFIPIWIGNLTNLRVFTAYENEIGGTIPDNLGLKSELQLLNLHSNQLEGTIPESIFALGKLEILVLTLNQLTGNLPEGVGNCKGLSSIRIGNNKITGSIPGAIGNVSSLTYFEADDNNLWRDCLRVCSML
ncbi:Leucine-rich repeat receptor-like tyrosine-protein kinase PXC3 [Camellia lanceoleosa]|uniref:Leucine-rich repeat receptor-like tyrosine-protein kinase PXC3 n=1 Tax=Camellia lanceoleosa TaxID=1840588 RepID=A0ACC0FRP3_9ERIC|nr:Leucine-rich repeat receptor-like tyrosine-protein kinase PXC3 [Camellia lanceoleosa]